MDSRRVIGFVAAGALSLLPSFLAAEGPKVDAKLEKGQTLGFTVKRSGSFETSGGQRDFKGTSSSETEYKIEVAEKSGNDVVLKVVYAALKARSEGGQGDWEFDSSKKEGGDEAAGLLRDAIAKPITVKVSGGRIADVSGFPEVERPQAGGDFRRLRGLRFAGREALRSDLELILASPVLGKILEKDKSYVAERESSGDAEARGGRFFGRQNVRLALKYEGEEKADGVPAAKFSLLSAREARPDEKSAGGGQAKAKGSALVSLADGLLLKLEGTTETSNRLERDGRSIDSSSKGTVAITRAGGAKKEGAVDL